VFISPFYTPSIGGVETIVRDTTEDLARRDFDVSVVTTTLNSNWTIAGKKGKCEINGVEVYRLSTKKIRIGYAALMVGLRQTLKELEPQIVHCHNLHPHLFQSLKWKKELNYKVLAQLHFPEATGLDHLTAKIAYPMVMSYLSLKQKNVDAFIVHTNLEKNWLVRKGLDEKKIHKLRYPSISNSTIRKYRQDFSDYEKNGMQNRYVLYIGRKTKRKGIHVFLSAIPLILEQIPDIKYIIAGPNDEEYYSALLKIRDKLNLRDRVTFLGKLSEEDKYKYMVNSSIFVSPSLKDYTPVTLIEAQALGVPVISTDVGAISEIVDNGVTGILVDPDRPESLAEAISYLISNEDRRRIMGRKAAEWVKQNFLLENTVDTLIDVYMSLSELSLKV